MIADDVRAPAFAPNILVDFFKSPRRLEAENLLLRHQLSIALGRAPVENESVERWGIVMYDG
jgi:hypothetical protein